MYIDQENFMLYNIRTSADGYTFVTESAKTCRPYISTSNYTHLISHSYVISLVK